MFDKEEADGYDPDFFDEEKKTIDSFRDLFELKHLLK